MAKLNYKQMKLKLLTLLFAIFISNTITGQSLNEYEYVIIPAKYDFLKFNDQYQLNSLTKFLFEKEGFKTSYDNLEKPADLSNDPCSALTAKVVSNSSMFTTKIIIELVNCKNQKVLVSNEGKSKEKDYKKGYQDALRNAFESVSALNYNYVNKSSVATIEQIPEIAPVKTETAQSVEEAEIEEEVVDAIDVASDQVKETEDLTSNKEVGLTPPAIPSAPSVKIDTVETSIIATKEVLYAQANPLGYQLVDSTPKVIYVLLKSSQENVYFLRYKKGIVYKENDQWIVEYYDLDKLVKEVVTIKF